MSGHMMDLSKYIYIIVEVKMTLEMAVGVSTHYGLDDSGIEFRFGEIFPAPPDRPRVPHNLRYNRYRVFLEGKTAEAWY
jgi:hypothetical protein